MGRGPVVGGEAGTCGTQRARAQEHGLPGACGAGVGRPADTSGRHAMAGGRRRASGRAPSAPPGPRAHARLERFELGRTLGEGAAGKVRYAVDSQDPARTPYAIKVLDREAVDRQGMMPCIKQEIRVMRALRHPCIVRLHEVLASQKKIYLVIELVTGGELYDRVAHDGHLNEVKVRRYLQQLVDAIDYCHSKGVYHRDLKPENILLDTSSDTVKIADFGLAAVVDLHAPAKERMLRTLCGSPNYVAPEVLREESYDGAKADVWALGVIAFMMVSGRLPFHSENMPELYRQINKAEYRVPGYVSNGMRYLLRKVLEPDPSLRATIAEVRNDPWFLKGGYVRREPLPDPSQLRRLRSRPPAATAGRVSSLMHQVTISDVPRVEEEKSTAWISVGGRDGSASDSAATSDSSEPGTPRVRRVHSLNAFELIAMGSMGLDLSAMFEKRKDVVGRHTRFCAEAGVEDILSAITSAASDIGAVATDSSDDAEEGGEAAAELRLDWTGARGPAAMRCEVFRLAPGIHMCDCCRIRGDGFEVHSMYTKLVVALGDLVLKNRDDVRAFDSNVRVDRLIS